MPGKIFCSGNPSEPGPLVPRALLLGEGEKSPPARCGDIVLVAEETSEGVDDTLRVGCEASTVSVKVETWLEP